MRGLSEPPREALSLTAVLHALSDPTRLEVVRVLDGDERHCSEFETSLSKPSLSHHFRVLRDAGLTHTRRSGRYNYLSLRRQDLEDRFPGLLDSILRLAADCALESGATIREPSGQR
jgi:DNA-binding transcriptional ArsR family regulator